MLFRRPCYYDSFTCTADKCTDNCCIGWEICIDEDTHRYYKTVDGEFGERLDRCISKDEAPSFILENERCPFLNGSNLCDIISTLGEDSLCQICRDHPRWFEWYGNEKEGGIGLSCEEGARLILTEEGFADYYESEICEEPDEDFDEEAYRFLLGVREELFDILSDSSLTFTEKAETALELCISAEEKLCSEARERFTLFDFNGELKRALPLLEKTEPIDEKWVDAFKALKASMTDLCPTEDEEKYLTRILAYFIWRYFLTSVFDYRVAEKLRLGRFSVTVIFALYNMKKEQGFSALLRSAVLYSKQMEYSEENLNIFFEEC